MSGNYTQHQKTYWTQLWREREGEEEGEGEEEREESRCIMSQKFISCILHTTAGVGPKELGVEQNVAKYL